MQQAVEPRPRRVLSALQWGAGIPAKNAGTIPTRGLTCGSEQREMLGKKPCSFLHTHVRRRAARLQGILSIISHGFGLKSASITSHVALDPHCSLHRGMRPVPHAGASQPQTVSHTPSCEQ